MGQPVAMFEITADDNEKAAEFYGRLFGWAMQPIDDEYSLVNTEAGDDAIPGGIGRIQRGGVPRTTVYVRVDDLQECLDRAAALGGSTLVPPTPLPAGYGSFAVLTDPEGTPVGLWA